MRFVFNKKFDCFWLQSCKTLTELTSLRSREANDALNNMALVAFVANALATFSACRGSEVKQTNRTYNSDQSVPGNVFHVLRMMFDLKYVYAMVCYTNGYCIVGLIFVKLTLYEGGGVLL